MQRRTFLYLAASAVLPSTLFGYARPVRIYTPSLQTIALIYRDLCEGSELALIFNNINILGYLQGVLEDSWLSLEHKDFIKQGALWLDEDAKAATSKVYSHQDMLKRQQILRDFSKTPYGYRWLATLYGYFFEAMLCDPVYGGNIDAVGWHYLKHTGGMPRPSKALV